MAKKVAVLAVNPVNGSGLFQYLEAFFENSISFKTFAVADTKNIITNSGIQMQTDAVIAELVGHEEEFDAVVFACGDAMPKFSENASKQFNQDMLTVLKAFNTKGKYLIGHCVAGLLFDSLEISKGKRITLHPFVKPMIKNSIATDEKHEIDGNLFTAQNENSIATMLPAVLDALK